MWKTVISRKGQVIGHCSSVKGIESNEQKINRMNESKNLFILESSNLDKLNVSEHKKIKHTDICPMPWE